jgi:hypothetical protein
VVLPHTYQHLSPVVSRRHARRRGTPAVGRERGPDVARHQPGPQPGSLTRSSPCAGLVVTIIFRRSPLRERLFAARVARRQRATEGAAFCAALIADPVNIKTEPRT